MKASSQSSSTNLYFDIARVVRNQESLSRVAIASNLSQSPTTIGRAVDQLIAENVIIETGEKEKNGVGRPSKKLQFNEKYCSVLSVDLRSTEVYAAVTDLSGNILATIKRDMSNLDGTDSIKDLIDVIRNLIQSCVHCPPVRGFSHWSTIDRQCR